MLVIVTQLAVGLLMLLVCMGLYESIKMLLGFIVYRWTQDVAERIEFSSEELSRFTSYILPLAMFATRSDYSWDGVHAEIDRLYDAREEERERILAATQAKTDGE